MYGSFTQQIKDVIKRLASMVDHSDVKIRKLALECLEKIFKMIDDPLETLIKHFFKGMRDMKLNEIKAIYKKKKKSTHGVKLFEGEGSTTRVMASLDSAKNSHDTSLRAVRMSGADLASIIPIKLFEMPYLSSTNEKKAILDDFYKNIEHLPEVKVPNMSTQASSLIKILRDCLEEANLLIVTVAIQVLNRLIVLMPGCFNEIVTRQILLESAFKYQSSTNKNTINDLILNFFTTAIRMDVVSLNSFLDLAFEQIQNHKKMNVRECFLVWLEHKLHEVEQNPSKMSLRDSIDWSYNADGQQTERNGKRQCVDIVNSKLKEIMSKESNAKIKGLLKTHLKKFEEIQMSGERPEPNLPKLPQKNTESKKIFKRSHTKRPSVNLPQVARRNSVELPQNEPQSVKLVPKSLPKEPKVQNTDSEKYPLAQLAAQSEEDRKSLLNYSLVDFNNSG